MGFEKKAGVFTRRASRAINGGMNPRLDLSAGEQMNPKEFRPARALTGIRQGEPWSWAHQHGGAGKACERNPVNRLSTQPWNHDPRSRALQFGKRVHACYWIKNARKVDE